MKKLVLLILILLLVGTWLGDKMVKDPGYVLFSYDQTTIETSLWVFLLLAIVGFAVLHTLLNLSRDSRLPWQGLRNWRNRRAQRSAYQHSQRGMQAYAEGDWWRAHRELNLSIHQNKQPQLANFLYAARAADAMGKPDAADALLEKANQALPKASLAIEINRAELSFARGQFETAQAQLQSLLKKAPKNSQLLQLMLRTLQALHDWDAIAGLIPQLRKHKVIAAQQLDPLEEQCYLALLDQAFSSLDKDTPADKAQAALSNTWNRIPKALVKSPALRWKQIECLEQAGAHDRAAELLAELLGREWQDDWVIRYGLLQTSHTGRQLETAKRWLDKHPDSAALLLTLGRLSLHNQHWGQAASYFEQSLQARPTGEAYSELARLMFKLESGEAITQRLADNLTHMQEHLPELPMPKQPVRHS